MRTLPHLIQYLTSHPLAIEPRFLALARGVFRQALAQGQMFDGRALHAALDVPMDEEREDRPAPARLEVVPIMGVIGDRNASLGTSAEAIDRQFSAAIADENIDAILFDVDSPGGIISGVPELADKIEAARGAKPMLAYSGGMMASAAYWIGAAAGEVISAPSSLTGSIGVFTWHEDLMGFLEKEGIVVTEFSAGEFKTEDAPWNALTDEAKAAMQAQVDQAYGWFVESVAGSRNTTQAAVRAGYGQGRVLFGQDALEADVVDSLGTFDDAVARLVARMPARDQGRRASALRREQSLAAVKASL